MFRRILISILLTGLVGVLVFGAVNRTLARADAGNGQGEGRNANISIEAENQIPEIDRFNDQLNSKQGDGDCQGNGSDQGQGQGQSQGQGQGQGQGKNQGQGIGQDNDIEEGNGIGKGDGIGSGNGKGQGKGNSQGRGNGYRGGNSGDQTMAIEWLTYEGAVQFMDEISLVILATNGETVEISDRAWRYAQEQGFLPKVGDQVTLTSFYDDYGSLEVASISDLTNNQSITLRDVNGRPMWAGRGS